MRLFIHIIHDGSFNPVSLAIVTDEDSDMSFYAETEFDYNKTFPDRALVFSQLKWTQNPGAVPTDLENWYTDQLGAPTDITLYCETFYQYGMIAKLWEQSNITVIPLPKHAVTMDVLDTLRPDPEDQYEAPTTYEPVSHCVAMRDHVNLLGI